ncbi:MAG TPA: BTAD domain-containing putative transcriptional regulator [Gaiellaceae bacterium]|nr:BTAD domain-containing putative transcriptional regulator [Gaiellaceae bacterium]
MAILLLNANRVVSVDRIVEDLYAEAAPVTALKQVQRQISELRKALGSSSAIETRSPGYVIHLSPEQLDLSRFERLAADATAAFSAGDPRRAAELVRQALELWRGDPLADLTYESFAQASIERLHEIRFSAIEQRIEADLALGRHNELAAELEQLVEEHPVRERLHGQLMLTLYRTGRQADALAAYREARAKLMDGFGLEPSPALKELERRILEQDPLLEPAPQADPAPFSGSAQRTVLAVPADDSGIARMAMLAAPLARLPEQELIVARLMRDEAELAAALSSLSTARQASEATIRVAAFTSAEQPADLGRLARAYDIDLLLGDAPAEIDADVAALLAESPADVGLVSGPPVVWGQGRGIFVPFGGTEHDWAALELGTWLASSAGVALRVVGARGDPERGRRDASRLLANASLAVQRLVEISAEPVLVEPTPDALARAVETATLVVVGLSARWRVEGVGTVRGALLQTGRPVVLVHAGPRPGGLAPRDARTRFTWSLGT